MLLVISRSTTLPIPCSFLESFTSSLGLKAFQRYMCSSLTPTKDQFQFSQALIGVKFEHSHFSKGCDFLKLKLAVTDLLSSSRLSISTREFFLKYICCWWCSYSLWKQLNAFVDANPTFQPDLTLLFISLFWRKSTSASIAFHGKHLKMQKASQQSWVNISRCVMVYRQKNICFYQRQNFTVNLKDCFFLSGFIYSRKLSSNILVLTFEKYSFKYF